MAAMSFDMETSLDDFLGGKLQFSQPKKGHRSGMDAVFLAATANPPQGARVLDIGSGVGVAGLCLKYRRSDIDLTLLEIEAPIADLASQNAQHNQLAAQVITGDITSSPKTLEALGLTPNSFDHIICNPPFYDEARVTSTQNQYRATAHVGQQNMLELWLKRSKHLLKAKGHITLIHRADALAELLHSLQGFGALRILPLHGHGHKPAERLIVQAQLGSKGALKLLPPLVLNMADGSPTVLQKRIAFDGGAIDLDDWPPSPHI